MAARRGRGYQAYQICEGVALVDLPASSQTLPLHVSYEHGINTFDTADTYSNGLSERILGRAIRQLNLPREEIVVLTKASLILLGLDAQTQSLIACTRPTLLGPAIVNITIQGIDPDKAGLVNQWGLSRKHIFDSVKASLERLQLDYIDVLQCMFPGMHVHKTEADTRLIMRPPL